MQAARDPPQKRWKIRLDTKKIANMKIESNAALLSACFITLTPSFKEAGLDGERYVK